MIEFSEYEYKNTENRFRINFERIDDSIYNTWERTNFISRISTCYYKVELINTIAIAINNGVNPRNIIILDKAYRLNESYKGFSNINLDSPELNRIFSLGKPISLIPHSDIIELNLFFDYCYEINQVLYKYGKKRISRNDRLESYQKLYKDGIYESLDLLQEISISKINDENYSIPAKQIASIKDKVTKKYIKYIQERQSFDSINTKLDCGDILEEEEEKIYKSYFDRFFSLLIQLPRPIVGIYNSDNKNINILCCDHFDSNVNYNSYIDLKSLTHYCPVKAIIEGGISVYSAYKDEKRKKELFELEKEKSRLEIIKLNLEIDALERDKVIKELNIISSSIETLKQVSSLADAEELKGIKSLASNYVNKQLCDVYRKNQDSYDKVLRDNKFELNTQSIINTAIDIQI